MFIQNQYTFIDFIITKIITLVKYYKNEICKTYNVIIKHEFRFKKSYLFFSKRFELKTHLALKNI